MRLLVDPWDPSYGASVDADPLVDSGVSVALDVEHAPEAWRPTWPDPTTPAPSSIVFVDGVRRIDARVWIDDGDNGDAGLCASWAAGAVRCAGAMAEITAADVERGLFSSSAAIVDLTTRHGTYRARRSAAATLDALSLALQGAMAATEHLVAARATAEDAGALLVTDGPLHVGGLGPGAIGFVKTHHRSYLDGRPRQVLNELAPGARTPAFTISGAFPRHSWYVRLASGSGAPMSGVVRCECSADVGVADLVRLADATAAHLPGFASEPHKDPRAPQNLYPIGGLERELRRRLGDSDLLYRAVRQAADR